MIKFIDVYDGQGEPHPRAVAFLFDLIAQRMTEPEVNVSATMPTLADHRAFVRRWPYRFWYLVEVTPETPDEAIRSGGFIAPVWVGYVSATRRNEIGIVLLKAHRGKGYGAQAVRMLMEKYQPLPAVPSERRGMWLANVAPGNEHSKHLFGEKLGGRLLQVTYELQPRGKDGEGKGS